MKEEIRKICNLIILILILFPIFSFAQNTSNEIIGKLAIPGALRECPSTDCKIIRYYAETAKVKIIGLDDSNKWYQVIANDDYGNKLNGWMHYSIFVDDYRTIVKNLLKNYKQTITQKEQTTPSPLSGENHPSQNNWVILYYGIVVIFIVIIFSAFYFFRSKIKDISRLKSNAIASLKIKLKQTRFINSLFIVLVIMAGIIGIGYGIVYYRVSKLLKNAEQLTKDEKYNEAIGKLEAAQNELFIKNWGVKKHEINNEIEKNKKLLEDKSEYIHGVEEFNKGNWEKAKELLSKVSEISPYYQDAKVKLEEIQNKIVERQISEAVSQALKKQSSAPITSPPTLPEKEKIQDEQEIKALLQQQINIYSKGIQKMDDNDLKTLYSIRTPNYRAEVSFPEFKKSIGDVSTQCNFYEVGPPVSINLSETLKWLYENDPQFSEIKKQMSFFQFFEAIKKEHPNLKEKLTIKEWNEIFPEEQFSEEYIKNIILLCKGGKIELENVKIKVDEFSEGKWAKVIYKVKINNQEISEFDATEENPEIYRKVNNKWYLVEGDKNAPGFNLADLPPDIRGAIKSQGEEEKSTIKTEEKPSKTEFKTSEIVENFGRYIVRVSCVDDLGNWTIGSGIIIGKSIELEGSRENTLILTNYHVVENASVNYSTPCFVEYSHDPTKGFTDFYWATPVYFPKAFSEDEMKTIDFYFLSIEEKSDKEGNIIPNSSLLLSEFVPRICNKEEIKIGAEITILGYPTIGGEYLSATEGIISGYEGTYYLTTSAKIEQGSSGGGAFLKSTGCLVGMPTFARLGKIESFARLINMFYLKENYLSKIFK
jgi:hypothetical protein